MANPSVYAKEVPDKAAVIMGNSGISYNWKQLHAAAVVFANLMFDRGVRCGDTVAWCIENRFEFIALIWAAQYSGLRYTPISTKLQLDETTYVISNSQAKLVFVSCSTCGQVGTLNSKQTPIVVNIDDLNEEFLFSVEAPHYLRAEGIPMLYSSGTTGKPKGVKVPFPDAPIDEIPEREAMMGLLYGIDANSVFLSTAPLYHTAPLDFVKTKGRLGATCVIMERFDAELALELIERHQVTHSQWVPTMFFRLLQLDKTVLQKYDLSTHKVAVHGAASCPVSIKEKIMDWWGPIVHEYYAGTEGVGVCVIGPEEWLTHKGSVGRCVTGKIRITDAAGNLLPPREVGDIWFDNCREFEYHNDSAKTADARTPNGYGTFNDVGYVDEEGYLYLTDRKSFTIVSGGVNIYPQEAEDILLTHPAVSDAAVFGIPNEEWGEEVKGAVELKEGIQASAKLEMELIDYCRERLAHLKCPKSIDFEEKLPRHPNGKLYKKVLQNRYRTNNRN